MTALTAARPTPAQLLAKHMELVDQAVVDGHTIALYRDPRLSTSYDFQFVQNRLFSVLLKARLQFADRTFLLICSTYTLVWLFLLFSAGTSLLNLNAHELYDRFKAAGGLHFTALALMTLFGAMAACTVIYIGVAAAAIGAQPFTSFAKSPEPLALILRTLNSGWAAGLVGAAAIIALPTVILAFLFGQTRIFFAMARDGLFPQALAKVNPRQGRYLKLLPAIVLYLSYVVLLAAVKNGVEKESLQASANWGVHAIYLLLALVMLHGKPRRNPARSAAA